MTGAPRTNGPPEAAQPPDPPPTRDSVLLAGATPDWSILEIGPSHAPVAPRSGGWNTTVVDHDDRAGLVAKYAGDPTVDTSRIEEVDVVWSGGPIDALIPAERHGTFDLMIASHVIEHFPDPVGVLRSLERLLRPDTGVVSLAVPDRRLCFDFFRPHSTTGKLLAAHRDGRSRHSAADIFDSHGYFAMLRDNIAWQWQPLGEVAPARSVHVAYTRFLEAREDAAAPYEDCHAWMFTPASFALIILELGELGVLDWRVERMLPQPSVEFIVHLRRGRRVFATAEAFEAARLDLLRETMRDLHAQTSAFLERPEPAASASAAEEQPPHRPAAFVRYARWLPRFVRAPAGQILRKSPRLARLLLGPPAQPPTEPDKR